MSVSSSASAIGSLGKTREVGAGEDHLVQFGELVVEKPVKHAAPCGQGCRCVRHILVLGGLQLIQIKNLYHDLLALFEMLSNDMFERLAVGGIDVLDVANDGFHVPIVVEVGNQRQALAVLRLENGNEPIEG